jgi:hypothetical protein
MLESNASKLCDLLTNYFTCSVYEFTNDNIDNFDNIKSLLTNFINQKISLEPSIIITKVYDFINNTSPIVIYDIISNNDSYRANILLSNIRKIEICIDKELLDDNKLCIQMLKIYANLSIIKEKTDYKDIIIEQIILFAKTKDNKYIDKLFGLAIVHKQYGIIDKIKYHVEFEKFINRLKTNKPSKVILQTKAMKTINLLKCV